MMNFTSIELTNWKNFTHAQVELSERVFLVGPNASGKSNFLDAFRFLYDLSRPGGGLQNACDARGGVSKIRSLSARRVNTIGIRVVMRDDNAEWIYEIIFKQEGQIQRQGTPLIDKEVVHHNGELILNRPDEEDRKDDLRLTQTALEQINFNYAFRDIPAFFETIHYLHLVPQIVRNGVLMNDPNVPETFGGNFLERVAREKKNIRNARFRRIQEILSTAVPQFEEIRLEKDDRGAPHLQVSYRHWRDKPAKQDESQLSDGTLRMIALLWALEEGAGPLLLEEPELSLHTSIVRQLVPFMHRNNRKSRQIILSTHSYELLSDPGISGHETLLFQPQDEGTVIQIAASLPHIKALLETGLSVGEAALPTTEPENIYQLPLL